ncbi:RNA-binding S4 domain-containing protein [Vibrio proteolyticus]|uniref:Uncharacterized protein n=1 Tax=Vibrio proteolyticus NBRC 13287 TaxID=1219065 RepID=U2ZGP7_VIBPR|nr:RNA-binding S4 domain-containing protein [Vibrio proteolyticus]GAD66826.1 hypothetical protein VPR01S_05_01210 [Vibrio proteolyticus NBRC 13287]
MTTELNEQHEQEIEIEAEGIEVSAQPIELYKVMKIANLVSGGGEAKHAIAEGYVAVNGELETRKRRKLYDGDFFEFNQEYYVVLCDAPVSEPEPKAKQPASKAAKPVAEKKHKRAGDKSGKKANSKTAPKEQKSKPSRDENSGRNSIDFF